MGKYTHDLLEDLLGDGIFTVDGDKWREQRKVSSHEFSTKVLRDFSSVIFRKNTIKLGNILSEAANSNQIIDINDLFLKATMDSIFKVAIGIDVDNMSASSEEGGRFIRAFDDANRMIVRRFVDISWKIKKHLNIGSEAELKKNMKVINEFLYNLIQTKFEEMHNTKDESSIDEEEIDLLVLELDFDSTTPIATKPHFQGCKRQIKWKQELMSLVKKKSPLDALTPINDVIDPIK
ncbi:hypothetical protein L2E82_45741 [Cichorium intybus]|uniref:Uncharacterized protein n=1 Tax=Cichorium intybus TaxID=13427 RepID=A0ACB8ZU68_CICIN|nr:hypothetical protein L2E82_45741 [Cichorium intybus]